MRYRREHLSARQPPYFPLLEDLMRDGSDGAALLAVVHYYCPEQMKLDGECGAPPGVGARPGQRHAQPDAHAQKPGKRLAETPAGTLAGRVLTLNLQLYPVKKL